MGAHESIWIDYVPLVSVQRLTQSSGNFSLHSLINSHTTSSVILQLVKCIGRTSNATSEDDTIGGDVLMR